MPYMPKEFARGSFPVAVSQLPLLKSYFRNISHTGWKGWPQNQQVLKPAKRKETGDMIQPLGQIHFEGENGANFGNLFQMAFFPTLPGTACLLPTVPDNPL